MPKTDNNTVLAIKNISVEFDGFKALTDVRVDVKRHTIHLFIGPNGAGKTTLLDIICAKTKPTQGTVHFYPEGRESMRLTGMKEYKQVLRPFKIYDADITNGSFCIKNMKFFTSLSCYSLSWTFEREGKLLASGSVASSSNICTLCRISSITGKIMLDKRVLKTKSFPTQKYPNANRIRLIVNTNTEIGNGITFCKITENPVTPPAAKPCGSTIMANANAVRQVPSTTIP